MVTRKATAHWSGDLKSGKGSMTLGSGAWSGPFSFRTRFEAEPGTNPEELIGAALAGCFSMACSHALAEAGFPPLQVDTTAGVRLAQVDGGFAIDQVQLTMRASVPRIDADTFLKIAQQAKESCPVSKALAGTRITLEATLQS
ncbi:MAG: OsmC family protein [Phycisphaerales bacterium]|nr:OsmC family protein [Phycisphaerales bacterium]